MDNETLIPTHGLRFVTRAYDVPTDTFGGGTVRKHANVLQQRFTTTGGKEVWKDVPCTAETVSEEQR
jgi:hypothetical protein